MTEPTVILCTKHTQLPKIPVFGYGKISVLAAQAKHAARGLGEAKVVYVWHGEVYVRVEEGAK